MNSLLVVVPERNQISSMSSQNQVTPTEPIIGTSFRACTLLNVVGNACMEIIVLKDGTVI